MKITTALILCAGYGTRLRPLTDILPKPLLSVRGKPMLCRILDKLADAGIERFFVNTHHLAQKFEDFFESRDGRFFYENREVTFVNEPDEILDTGGGLKNILPLTDVSTPILVHNGDIFFDAPAKDFIARAELNADSPECSATLCLCDGGNLCNVGVQGERVVDMRFKTGATPEKLMQFCGVFAANPKILRALLKYDKKIFSIVDVFLESINSDENSVRGFAENRGEWLDIGTPAQYVEVNRGYAPDRLLRLAQLREYGFFASENSDIGKGGSMRDFFRFSTEKGDKLIACFYSEQKRENFLYAPLAEFLAAQNFPVPQILFHSPQDRALIMRDLGLADLMSSPDKPRYYKLAIAQIKRLHKEITKAFLKTPLELSQPFDKSLYDWEQDYFFNECVKSRFCLACAERPEDEFKAIQTALMNGAQTLLHRDLQSQNIIVSDAGEIGFIDFQGMRFGNPYYDIASLLYDPYVKISPDLRDEILRDYISGSDTTFAEAEKTLAVAACERLMQALGAYGFLSAKKGLREYENYFAPALDNLKICAKKAGFKKIEALADSCIDRLHKTRSV